MIINVSIEPNLIADIIRESTATVIKAHREQIARGYKAEFPSDADLAREIGNNVAAALACELECLTEDQADQRDVRVRYATEAK